MEESARQQSIANTALSSDSLSILLDTQEALKRIEVFLNGQQSVYTEDTEGNPVEVIKTVGLRKASQEGVQSIYSWVSNVLNVPVVRGNFPMDEKGYSEAYEDFIYYFRLDFTDYLMKNIYAFEILDSEFEGIIDNICNIVNPFMTRLMGNKERESHQNSIEHKTTYSQNRPSIFGG